MCTLRRTLHVSETRSDSPSRSSRGLRAAAAAAVLVMTAAGSAQTVFSATERVDPGQNVTLTGSGFSPSTRLTARRYAADGSLGAPVNLSLLDQSDLGAVTQLPAGSTFGMYRIDASDAGSTGGTTLVNAPRIQWADTPYAMAGGSVRLVGRNLHPATNPTTVRLVDVATGASLAATTTVSRDYAVTFTVPAGVVTGHAYRVLLNSGIAGSASEVTAPETLGIVAKAADPFGLETYWAGDFVPIAARVYNLKSDARLPMRASGNGKADDTPALQAAIDYAAKSGGGTVYVPAGTYRIDNGNAIRTRSRVVVKGDGAGKTILQTGYRFTASVAPPSYGWAILFENAPDSGMTALTIRNLNANAKPSGVFRSTSGQTVRCFLKNVDFEINNGMTPNLNYVREAVVQGCRFTSTSTTEGPIGLGGARYLRFVGNTLDHRVGRDQFVMGYRQTIEGNTFRINGAYQTPGSAETGGVETSYGQQVLVANNTFQIYGPAPTKTGDCEMLGTQISIVPDFWDAGNVASADATTLTPSGKTWPANWFAPNYDPLDRSYVAIVRGKGAGQWRRVAAHTANGLTVDRPWAVRPDSTSVYSVGSLVGYQHTYANNTFQGSLTGISLWSGGMDTLITDNQLTNAGSIVVRAASEFAPGSTTNLAQCIAWNVSVRNNALTCNNGLNAACVSISNFVTYPVAQQSNMGSLVLGIDVAYNAVTGSQFVQNWPITRHDGYEVLAWNERGLPLDSLSNWGTSLWSNSVTNSAAPYDIARVNSVAVDGVLDVATVGVSAS